MIGKIIPTIILIFHSSFSLAGKETPQEVDMDALGKWIAQNFSNLCLPQVLRREGDLQILRKNRECHLSLLPHELVSQVDQLSMTSALYLKGQDNTQNLSQWLHLPSTLTTEADKFFITTDGSVFSVEDPTKIQTLFKINASPNWSFFQNGEKIAVLVSSPDHRTHEVKIFETRSGKLLRSLPLTFPDDILGLNMAQISLDGKLALINIHRAEHQTQLISLETGEAFEKYQGLTYYREGKYFLIGDSSSKKISILSLEESKRNLTVLRPTPLDPNHTYYPYLSQKADRVGVHYSGSEEEFRIFDIEGRELGIFPLKNSAPIVSSDLSRLAVISRYNDKGHILDVTNGKRITELHSSAYFTKTKKECSPNYSGSFSPDKTVFVVSMATNEHSYHHFFEVSTGKWLGAYSGKIGEHIGWIPDNNKMVFIKASVGQRGTYHTVLKTLRLDSPEIKRDPNP